MKRCPTCNRTFEDELTFCLVDGAVLSAPEDPLATRLFPPPRPTDPSPTEVLIPPTVAAGEPPTLYPTIPAQPPQLYSDKSALRPPKKRAPRFILITAVGLVVIAIAGVIILELLFAIGNSKIPANVPVNRSTTNSNHKSATTSSRPPSTCFGEDAGAGVRDRAGHYAWAKQHDVAAMTQNLMYKADLLFHCASMNEESLSNAFADISVSTAKAAPDAHCFGGDEGAIGTDRERHKNAFSNAPDRKEQLLRNLKWKMGAALNCLHQSEQASYFADVSVLMADAPE